MKRLKRFFCFHHIHDVYHSHNKESIEMLGELKNFTQYYPCGRVKTVLIKRKCCKCLHTKLVDKFKIRSMFTLFTRW